MKFMAPVYIMVVALFALALAGCSSQSKEPGDSSTPTATDDHGDHSHQSGDGKTDMEKMKAELAKMSPEDAASAEKQHICPVSGEMLGVMGAPQKIDVSGQHVWICCIACKDKLLEDPDKYLAKLKP